MRYDSYRAFRGWRVDDGDGTGGGIAPLLHNVRLFREQPP